MLQRELQGLQGIRNIADDIVVFGITRAEHDSNLENCLRRLLSRGLKLKGYEQQKILLLHLKEHEKISRLAV